MKGALLGVKSGEITEAVFYEMESVSVRMDD